ncbi:RyR domain-containing protein, partial [Dehalococcoidia bacterium]|nr:RyR domain-containing protein [Dehalococcoidia bacterium]
TTDWDPLLFEFSPEEVELMAKMEHERFVEERLRQGFRRGIAKDLEKKITPTIVPWDDLPEEERQKDRDTVRGLPAFLAGAGFQVYRSRREA